MIDLSADIAAMLDPEHFGVPVTFDGAPACLYGRETFSDVGHVGNDGYAEVIGRQRTLVLDSAVAALLKVGMDITVNGESRRVLDPRALQDGPVTLVTLQ